MVEGAVGKPVGGGDGDGDGGIVPETDSHVGEVVVAAGGIEGSVPGIASPIGGKIGHLKDVVGGSCQGGAGVVAAVFVGVISSGSVGVGVPVALVSGRFDGDVAGTVDGVQLAHQLGSVVGSVHRVAGGVVGHVGDGPGGAERHVEDGGSSEAVGDVVDEDGPVSGKTLNDDQVGVGGHSGVVSGGGAVTGGDAGHMGAVAVGVPPCRGDEPVVDLFVGVNRSCIEHAQDSSEDILRGLPRGGGIGVPEIENSALTGGGIDEILVGPIDSSVDDSDDDAFAGVPLGVDFPFPHPDRVDTGLRRHQIVGGGVFEDRFNALDVGEGGDILELGGGDLYGGDRFGLTFHGGDDPDGAVFLQGLDVACCNVTEEDVEARVSPTFLDIFVNQGVQNWNTVLRLRNGSSDRIGGGRDFNGPLRRSFGAVDV